MGYNSQGYKTKHLTVRKIGWKRIAKNTQRFGWILDDATIHTDITETTTYEGRVCGDTIYINPRTNRKSKTRVWLSFYRVINVGAGVATLEFFYNVIYILRKILAFCLPFLFVGGLVLFFLNCTEISLRAFYWATGFFFGWIGCIIFEGVFSRIAGSVLKNRANPKPQPSRTAAPVTKPIPAPASRTAVPAAYTPPVKDCPEPYGNDDVVTLKSKNGEDIDFVEIAGIAYKGNFYAILQPVELLDGMDDNEALVFKVTRNQDGEDNFEVELNDEIIDAVFVEYNRLVDEAEGKRSA